MTKGKQPLHGDVGSVCAVIVAYHPDEAFAVRLKAILAQVDEAVIVDNGAAEKSNDLLAKLAKTHKKKLTLLENPDNGLAKAQNIGIRFAHGRDHEWVLLFDDDSEPEADMVEHMLGAYQAVPPQQRVKIGLVAPDIIEEGMPPFPYPVRSGFFGCKRTPFTSERVLHNVLYVCASGSLIRTRLLFGAVGLMDESYYIYWVDVEFCLRMNKQKHRIMVVRDARLHHRLGERTQHEMLGKTITTTNHSPEARYYQYRNRVRLWREYGLAFAGFMMFDYLRMNYEMFRVLFVEKDSRHKLKAMMDGFMDGLLGRSGKREEKEES